MAFASQSAERTSEYSLCLAIELAMGRLDDHSIAGFVQSTGRPVVVVCPGSIRDSTERHHDSEPQEIPRRPDDARCDQAEPKHEKQQGCDVAPIPRPPHPLVHRQQHWHSLVSGQNAEQRHQSRNPQQPNLALPPNSADAHGPGSSYPRQHASIGKSLRTLIRQTQYRTSHSNTNHAITHSLPCTDRFPSPR